MPARKPQLSQRLLLRVGTALGAVITFSSLAAPALTGQTGSVAHSLTLANAVETIDGTQRRVIVAHLAGDLPGVLTMALQVGTDGRVSGGEWALNVSYIRFGPPDKDGDGDASEYLVQRGVLKGTLHGGAGSLAGSDFLQTLDGVELDLTGATVEFAAVRNGHGTLTGRNLNQPGGSAGLLTLTF